MKRETPNVRYEIILCWEFSYLGTYTSGEENKICLSIFKDIYHIMLGQRSCAISMRILVIAGRSFGMNTKSGGEQVSLRNYRLIQKMCGIENAFLCMFSNECNVDLPENTTVFPTKHNKWELLIDTIMLRNVCSRKTLRRVIDYVKKIKPDVIFADSSNIGYLVEKCKIDVPIFVFFHNIEKNYSWNKIRHEGILYWFAYRSYYKNERKILSVASKTILLNIRDDKELQRIYGRSADFILPVTFDDKFDEYRIEQIDSQRKALLFVGSLFQPNYEGIRWFVEKVMSQFVSDKYLLKIVGKNLETKRSELQRENVEIIGTVEDLADYYYSADAVVLPIFYGDGMKVKTAEAMMYGKKIFATKEALEGYDVGDIEEVYECNSKDEFVQNISKYLDNSVGYKFCKNVRGKFLEKYETKAVETEFKKFLQNGVG